MTNGNGKKDRLDRIEEYLNMAAHQTAENAKQITKTQEQLRKSAVEHDREMKEIRARHNREMKEIRDLIDRTDWARVREKLRAAALRNRRMSK